LKRNDAINLLYKIYNTCHDITINAIRIEAKENKGSNSDQEFVLVIKSSLSPISQSILKTIVKNHELELSKTDQVTIISSGKKYKV
jgi:hypothetical protein